MEFGGYINFEGKNGLQLIREYEDNLIEVYLRNDDENDMSLNFSSP